MSKIASKFDLSLDYLSDKTSGNGIKLSDHIFFQRAPRFDWPDENSTIIHNKKTCYALRDHIAILSNGKVVPCCLDADANIELGNIFNEDLSAILDKERARVMKKGFVEKKIVEKLCASCGFSKIV